MNLENIEGFPEMIIKIAWTVSNILTTSNYVNLRMTESKIFTYLIEITKKINNVKVNFFCNIKLNKHILIAISNLLLYSKKDTKLKLIMTVNTSEYLCKTLLNSLDNDVLSLCIDGVFMLMEFGEMEGVSNFVKIDLEKCGIIEILEKYTNHNNEGISLKSVKTLEEFWGKKIENQFN